MPYIALNLLQEYNGPTLEDFERAKKRSCFELYKSTIPELIQVYPAFKKKILQIFLALNAEDKASLAENYGIRSETDLLGNLHKLTSEDYVKYFSDAAISLSPGEELKKNPLLEEIFYRQYGLAIDKYNEITKQVVVGDDMQTSLTNMEHFRRKAIKDKQKIAKIIKHNFEQVVFLLQDTKTEQGQKSSAIISLSDTLQNCTEGSGVRIAKVYNSLDYKTIESYPSLFVEEKIEKLFANEFDVKSPYVRDFLGMHVHYGHSYLCAGSILGVKLLGNVAHDPYVNKILADDISYQWQSSDTIFRKVRKLLNSKAVSIEEYLEDSNTWPALAGLTSVDLGYTKTEEDARKSFDSETKSALKPFLDFYHIPPEEIGYVFKSDKPENLDLLLETIAIGIFDNLIVDRNGTEKEPQTDADLLICITDKGAELKFKDGEHVKTVVINDKKFNEKLIGLIGEETNIENISNKQMMELYYLIPSEQLSVNIDFIHYKILTHLEQKGFLLSAEEDLLTADGISSKTSTELSNAKHTIPDEKGEYIVYELKDNCLVFFKPTDSSKPFQKVIDQKQLFDLYEKLIDSHPSAALKILLQQPDETLIMDVLRKFKKVSSEQADIISHAILQNPKLTPKYILSKPEFYETILDINPKLAAFIFLSATLNDSTMEYDKFEFSLKSIIGGLYAALEYNSNRAQIDHALKLFPLLLYKSSEVRLELIKYFLHDTQMLNHFRTKYGSEISNFFVTQGMDKKEIANLRLLFYNPEIDKQLDVIKLIEEVAEDNDLEEHDKPESFTGISNDTLLSLIDINAALQTPIFHHPETRKSLTLYDQDQLIAHINDATSLDRFKVLVMIVSLNTQNATSKIFEAIFEKAKQLNSTKWNRYRHLSENEQTGQIITDVILGEQISPNSNEETFACAFIQYLSNIYSIADLFDPANTYKVNFTIMNSILESGNNDYFFKFMYKLSVLANRSPNNAGPILEQILQKNPEIILKMFAKVKTQDATFNPNDTGKTYAALKLIAAFRGMVEDMPSDFFNQYLDILDIIISDPNLYMYDKKAMGNFLHQSLEQKSGKAEYTCSERQLLILERLTTVPSVMLEPAVSALISKVIANADSNDISLQQQAIFKAKVSDIITNYGKYKHNTNQVFQVYNAIRAKHTGKNAELIDNFFAPHLYHYINSVPKALVDGSIPSEMAFKILKLYMNRDHGKVGENGYDYLKIVAMLGEQRSLLAKSPIGKFFAPNKVQRNEFITQIYQHDEGRALLEKLCEDFASQADSNPKVQHFIERVRRLSDDPAEKKSMLTKFATNVTQKGISYIAGQRDSGIKRLTDAVNTRRKKPGNDDHH